MQVWVRRWPIVMLTDMLLEIHGEGGRNPGIFGVLSTSRGDGRGFKLSDVSGKDRGSKGGAKEAEFVYQLLGECSVGNPAMFFTDAYCR